MSDSIRDRWEVNSSVILYLSPEAIASLRISACNAAILASNPPQGELRLEPQVARELADELDGLGVGHEER